MSFRNPKSKIQKPKWRYGRAWARAATSRVLGSLALAALIAPPAAAQVPGMVSFQGVLKDSTGVALQGSVTLDFRIFDAPTAGALVDMDGDGTVENTMGEDVKRVTTPAVTGVISTQFGPVSPSVLNGQQRFIEVTIVSPGPETALSRVPMTTAPAVAEQLYARGTTNVAVATDASGNVGIGTTVPAEPLDVSGQAKFGTWGRISTPTAGSGPPSLDGSATAYVYNARWNSSASLWERPGGGVACALALREGHIGLHNSSFDASGTPITWIERLNIAPNGNVGIGTSAPQTKLDVAGAISGFGIVPIGSIIAWHKNLPGVPALPDGWVECNGQTLSDPASPMNGQSIPDLNSTPPGYRGGGRFLRGASQSGEFQEGTAVPSESDVIPDSDQDQNIDPDSDQFVLQNAAHRYVLNDTTPLLSYQRIRPVNMTVVWVMRVK